MPTPVDLGLILRLGSDVEPLGPYCARPAPTPFAPVRVARVPVVQPRRSLSQSHTTAPCHAWAWRMWGEVAGTGSSADFKK